MTTCYQANLLDQDTEYNGWTNYETWNAALWIGNDQGLYDIASCLLYTSPSPRDGTKSRMPSSA